MHLVRIILVNSDINWVIIEANTKQGVRGGVRGGTSVGKAMQQILNAQIVSTDSYVQNNAIHRYATSVFGTVPREVQGKNIRVINNDGFTPPIEGQFAYIHCPKIKDVLIAERQYQYKTNSEGGLNIYYNPIRKKVRDWLYVFTYGHIFLKHAKTTKFLVNSKWGRDIMLDKIPQAKDVVTVYPPCDIPSPSSSSPPLFQAPSTKQYTGDKKRKIDVISIGAIVPYKRHHAVIDMCRKSRHVKNAMMIGFAYDDYLLKTYLKNIQNAAFQIKDKTVRINTTCSDAEKQEHMYNAKCVVSANWQEHFGIAVVEAMSRGCIPVVPDSMGFKETVPFEEIRFTNDDEAPKIIDDTLEGVYDDLVPKLKAYASKFSYEVFQNAIKREILDYI